MIDPKERCVAHICRGSYNAERCVRRGSVSENGKLWCKQHAPSLVKAKQEERDAKWRAKWDAKRKEDNRCDKLRELREKIADEALAMGYGTQGSNMQRLIREYRKLKDAQ